MYLGSDDWDLSKEDIKGKMTTVLPECWNAIKADRFDALVESMPNRITAVVKTKGWYQVLGALYIFSNSDLFLCLSSYLDR
jgi:hypothetical protein